MLGLSTAKITATRIHQNRKTGQKIEFQIEYCFADGTTQLETLKFSGKGQTPAAYFVGSYAECLETAIAFEREYYEYKDSENEW